MSRIFTKFAVSRELNKPTFNLAIGELLIQFNLPIISDSHLSNRIFDILDDSSDGRIQESEFIEGLEKVFEDEEFKTQLLFQAYQTNRGGQSSLNFNEIKDFLFANWCSAFELLGKILVRNKRW